MNYPTKEALELALGALAKQAGVQSTRPFRVEVLPVHGHAAPLYTVVILAQQRLPLRDRLTHVLGRSFAMGTGSFILKPAEALVLVSSQGQESD